MLQENKRSNAIPALTLPKSQDELQQPSETKQEAIKMVEKDNQDGPERFAPWYPLLQRIRDDNPFNQQHRGTASSPICLDESPERTPDWRPEDSANVFVNKLVPYHEYPAVQLKNGILTPQLSKPPRNLKWLQTRLLQRRVDSDWTPAGWQRYKAYPHFRRHRELTRVAMRSLFKIFPERSGYQRAYYQRWYDFPEYAPFAQGLEQPCPGFVQGFPFEAYRGLDIEYLGSAVCYRSDDRSLTLPHMAGEFAVGTLEAEEAADARHGAALVYMRNATILHAKMKKDPEDVAVIITFISDGLFIRFYAHYESRSLTGKVEYHQYPILAANLVDSYDEFLRGVAMLRNCQDLAFVLASETKNSLERYHVANGINAWTYHLDDGEHILSESEDSVSEGVGGQNAGTKEDRAQQEKQHASQSQAQQTTRVLRPRKRAAQEDKKTTPKLQKRQASEDAGKKTPKKRLRTKK
jgi:hypothetical protein